jgi:hypothetical protein
MGHGAFHGPHARRGGAGWCVRRAACARVVDAQAVKGSLVGNIMDPSGSVLPGVTVTITEVHTNIAYSAVTNESGNYTFSNLKDAPTASAAS